MTSSHVIADNVLTLQKADDAYYNSEIPIMSDAQYDSLRQLLIETDPTHSYLIGVGSDVRGSKIKLPYPMGSLDQKHEGETIKWVEKNELQGHTFCITNKLDGVSGMLVYNEFGLQICYSRGNGIEGADITRHLKHIVPNTLSDPTVKVIRGEVIMSKYDFELFSQTEMAKRDSGEPYKNARNAVAGILNGKTVDPEVYKYLSFVAYEQIKSVCDKSKELYNLIDLGFNVPRFDIMPGIKLVDETLTTYLHNERQSDPYEIDGLVITVNSKEEQANMRLKQTRDTLNPAYSIKYKVGDITNSALTSVTGVTWTASKHGYLKPTVQFEPVGLAGATIRNATGFNAKFIQENKVGVGAVIEITRSGDVIPYIKKVISGTVAEMPVSDWGWTVNDAGEEVDAKLFDPDTNPQVQTHRIIDFFSSIQAPMLKEGNVKKLIEADLVTIAEIINTDRDTLIRILGKNGGKAYDGLHNKLQNINRWDLMGSTNFFGRGVGKRRFKQLFEVMQIEDILKADIKEISKVKGFDEKTAKKIIIGMPTYLKWFTLIDQHVKFNESKKEVKQMSTALYNEVILFTGFRNAELEQDVEAAGGIVASSFSKKTTFVVAKDPTKITGKVKKAINNGISVIGLSELQGLLEK